MRRRISKIFRTNWSGLRLESQQGLWEKLGPITAATSVRRLRSSRMPQAESLSILRKKYVRSPRSPHQRVCVQDRKSVVSGKSVSVRVDLGDTGIYKKKQVNTKITA